MRNIDSNGKRFNANDGTLVLYGDTAWVAVYELNDNGHIHIIDQASNIRQVIDWEVTIAPVDIWEAVRDGKMPIEHAYQLIEDMPPKAS